MSTGRAPEHPRWALVAYPTNSIGCIPIDQVMVATMRGAVLIGSERDLLPWPIPVEPAQSNPRRADDDG